MTRNIARTNAERRQAAMVFADALAATGSIAAAGRAIGVSRPSAHGRFQRMCEALGPQALGNWRIPWPPVEMQP